MERQRPARVHWQGLFGFCEFHRRRRHLLTGDEAAAASDRTRPAAVPHLLEQCGQEGLSGTAVFTKQEPLSVTYDFGEDIHRHEGRVITCEYPDFYLVCCYTPNSQDELRRLSYRMEWEDALRQYLCELDTIKPVVYCGDLNVAHEEIDLKNPKTNHFNPGFSDEERGKMTQLLSSGFLDSFRTLYPDKTDAYSWWSYRAQSRARNVGWRIDYFIVSERLRSRIENADILAEVMGSDHCPVLLELKEEEK